MSWADYQPGRRVVCVADFSILLRRYCTAVPQKGRIYTIREALLEASHSKAQTLGLRFEEFSAFGLPGAPLPITDGEVAFEASCFRPLDETRLDVFRRMLAPSRQGVVA